MWRPRKGELTFTGLVQTPVPSPYWVRAGFKHGFARLIDKEGSIEGPIRMVEADEYFEVMADFD